jgi:predicted transporter
VTKDDLREIKGFGWLQQGLFGSGTFFFSGAFWLLAELVSHNEKSEFTSWMAMCILSILFGLVLISIGLFLHYLREKKLDKYFKAEPLPPTK